MSHKSRDEKFVLIWRPTCRAFTGSCPWQQNIVTTTMTSSALAWRILFVMDRLHVSPSNSNTCSTSGTKDFRHAIYDVINGKYDVAPRYNDVIIIIVSATEGKRHGFWLTSVPVVHSGRSALLAWRYDFVIHRQICCSDSSGGRGQPS